MATQTLSLFLKMCICKNSPYIHLYPC